MQSEIAQLITMEGYNFEHKASHYSSRGGWVGFLIDSSLKYKVTEHPLHNITTFEYLIIKLDITNNKSYYGTICIIVYIDLLDFQ